MKIIDPYIEILTDLNEDLILKHIELCARNCYKSENLISDDTSSAKKIISNLIKMDHLAMLEHFCITVRLVTDTGVLKDITRHRLCSFAVESTRYCSYNKDKFGNELTFIKPINIDENSEEFKIWYDTMKIIEDNYIKMAKLGAKPDQLRMILPHSLKSSIIITANVREWRHIFKLRCSKAAHPSVQQTLNLVLKEFTLKLPTLFNDLYID